MACKSPTHKRYTEAVEGLYIQAALAEKDLTKVLDEARLASPTNPGRALSNWRQRLDLVTQRLDFGATQVADAEHELNRHFARGCSNLDPIVMKTDEE